MKTEVYSWRVSAELKTGLELEARRRKISLSAALDLAARDWLKKGGSDIENDEEQIRLRNAALECCGAFEGGDAYRAENTRNTVRRRLRLNHGR
jgi:hypothetical protein